jgi:hypothetical protein
MTDTAMKHTQSLIAAAAFSGALWLAGCNATPDARIQSNPAAFAQLSPQEQSMVKAGQVGLGFSADAVKLALGNPDRITLKTDATGQVEVWHYIETAYYDGAFLYGGPYWGGWGGWGRHGFWGGGWGGYWGPYPVGPVSTYDHFRVVFRNGRVIEFNQEVGS